MRWLSLVVLIGLCVVSEVAAQTAPEPAGGFTSLREGRPVVVIDDGPIEYRLLATKKSSTMRKELGEAAAAGFRVGAMTAQTVTGSEVVVVLYKSPGAPRYEYRLITATREARMQTELQEASDTGFVYVGQAAFTGFMTDEVICLLERDMSADGPKERYEYRTLNTARTSTMQKELQELGDQSFEIVGLTIGGTGLVSILRRKLQ